MSNLVKEWYPDGVTCLQIYKEGFMNYFGTINGVEVVWAPTDSDCYIELQNYYEENIEID